MAKRQAEQPEDSQMYGAKRRGEKARNAKKITLILIAVLFGGVTLMAAWAMNAHHQDLTRLAKDGRVVAAKVTGRSEGGEAEHFLDYAFPVQDQTITGYKRVGITQYRQTRIGSTLTLTYLPSDPHVQQLGTVTQADVAKDLRSGLWAISFLTVFFTAMLWVVWRCFPEPREPYRVVFNKP